MINAADMKLAADFLAKLPVEDGIVTRADRQLPNGETQRVWAVEFPGQTIMLEFVFDEIEDVERKYAELLAKGTSLIFRLGEMAAQNELDAEDIMRAFQVTYTVLWRRYQDVKSTINGGLCEPTGDNGDESCATVGEKGD